MSDDLQRKYHMLIARCKDLQEQIYTKDRLQEEREKEIKTNEDNMRDLIYNILGTDKNEIVLGKQAAWSQLPIDELIVRGRKAFALYQKKQMNFQKRLIEQTRERGAKIEQLEAKVERLLLDGASRDMTEEELDKLIERENKEKKFSENMPDKLKDKGIERIEEDDGADLTSKEEDLYDDLDFVRVTPGSIPYKEGKKRKDKKESIKNGTDIKNNLKQIEEAEDNMSKEAMLLLKCIGDTGLSVFVDIKKEIMRNNRTIKESTLNVEFTKWYNKCVFTKETVTNPLRRTIMIVELSDFGRMIYAHKFDRSARESEATELKRNHNNLNHGYGIRVMSNELSETGEFETVTDDTRKKYKIKLADGIEYIPDIICIDKNGKKLYIEYETGTTSQIDFNGKMNKMRKVTDTLNIIVPNLKVAEDYCTKTKKWIENTGQDALKDITIRISGAEQMKGNKNIRKNESWKYVFLPGLKGTEPVVNN